MSSTNLLKSMLAVLSAVTALHILGLSFFLYWQFWWFDIIVHILGGIFMAEMVLYAYLYSGIWSKKSLDWRLLPTVLVLVLAIGIFWEFFELAIGATRFESRAYMSDSIKDLIDDCIGAFVGFAYVRSKR